MKVIFYQAAMIAAVTKASETEAMDAYFPDLLVQTANLFGAANAGTIPETSYMPDMLL